jgi:hypothetical protein
MSPLRALKGSIVLDLGANRAESYRLRTRSAGLIG